MIFKQFMMDNSLKNQNLKKVYNCIQQNGPIKKNDLLGLTKLKKTTLARMIDKLLQNDFIRESGFEKSSGGRPPITYEIVANVSYIIGVDISRTRTTIGLFNISLKLIDKVSFIMIETHTPDSVIEKIIDAINGFKVRYNLKFDDILGMGIGAVGPLDREWGIILNPESFLSAGWKNVQIVKKFEERLSIKTVLENGANSAAIGEFYQSSYKEENTLYCLSGIGLRCGVLTNGQIVKNHIGDATSFGHMIIDMNGKKCSCGHKGCLLSYMSHPSIVANLKTRIHCGEKSMITKWIKDDMNNITIELMLEACKLNDKLVNDVILKSAYFYGIGIGNMINMLHPNHIILNGPLINGHPTYFDEVVKTAKEYAFYSSERRYFSKGILKEDAVIVGAAVHLFNSY